MSVFSEYENYDGIALAELIAKREISPREVLDAAIERTEALNPQLNAIVHKLYDAAAATLATALPASTLSGVPFLLKDLNLLYAGAPLSNGSRLFADFIPDHDSTLTQRYKDAGLVIFGKTNTPEMGIAMATEPAGLAAEKPLTREEFTLYDFDNHSRPERAGKLDAIVNHMGNFFDCVAERRLPISDVESQHRSVSVCHLGNIAMRLGRTLAWDPEAEQFPEDREANTWLSREQRAGYELG